MKVLYEFTASKPDEMSLALDQVMSCDLIIVSYDLHTDCGVKSRSW